MKNRWLTIGFLFIATLAGIFLLLKKPAPAPDPETVKLSALDFQALYYISVSNADSKGGMQHQLTLEKNTAGVWWIRKPIEARANSVQLKKLLALLFQPSHRQFQAQPDKLAQYGLDKPIMKYTINGDSLSVGANDPVEKFRYILYREQIHLIHDSPSLWMDKSVENFIDPALVNKAQLSAIIAPGFRLNWTTGKWTLSGSALGTVVSQDELTAYAQEWQHAYGLKMSLVQETNNASKVISLHLKDQSKVLQLFMNPSNNSLTLGNIEYRLSPEKYRYLTQAFAKP